MNDRLRTLLSPLNFAGYLAWGAIGFEILVSRGSAAPGENAVVAGLHLAFLALFMAVTSGQRASHGARAMVLVQVGLTFVLMVLTRYTSVPILLILCVVQLVRVFSPRQSVVLIVLMNVAVYLIYRDIWQLRAQLLRARRRYKPVGRASKKGVFKRVAQFLQGFAQRRLGYGESLRRAGDIAFFQQNLQRDQ